MNNADIPAMPNSTNSCSIDAITNSSVTIEEMALWNRGLTKREYFAAHAPPTPAWFEFDSNEQKPPAPEQPGPAYGVARIAAWRYAYADAMLAEGK
jgi:hypothetical protein